jgi:hypothetical protein
VLPDRLAGLEQDIDAQAKTVFAMKALGFRPAALEAALSGVVPDLAMLLAD